MVVLRETLFHHLLHLSCVQFAVFVWVRSHQRSGHFALPLCSKRESAPQCHVVFAAIGWRSHPGKNVQRRLAPRMRGSAPAARYLAHTSFGCSVHAMASSFHAAESLSWF